MVLDNGEIVEYDSPGNLIKNENGSFYKFMKRAGLIESIEDEVES